MKFAVIMMLTDRRIRVYDTSRDVFTEMTCIQAQDVGWSILDLALRYLAFCLSVCLSSSLFVCLSVCVSVSLSGWDIGLGLGNKVKDKVRVRVRDSPFLVFC